MGKWLAFKRASNRINLRAIEATIEAFAMTWPAKRHDDWRIQLATPLQFQELVARCSIKKWRRVV